MRPATLALSDAQERAVAETMRRARNAESFEYPWHGLKSRLPALGGSLRLLGYGSLIDRDSAARTLGSTASRPVVVVGARRVFNYDIGRSETPETDPRARAALNVVVTGRRTDLVNGVLIEVPPEKVDALCAREKAYDLKPVACVSWDRPEEAPFLCYVLEAPDEPVHGARHTDSAIEPDLRYYRLCRAAAATYGEDFLRFWLDTTYLADGRTPVAGFEARVLELDGRPPGAK